MSELGGDRLIQTKLSSFFLSPERRKQSEQTNSQPSSRYEMSRDNSNPSEASKLVREQSSAEVERRQTRVRTARETKMLLPGVLKTMPNAQPQGYLCKPPNPPKLNHKYCPGFPSAAIKVLDSDTFDTAINLANCEQYMTVRDKRPVCVLNMANAYSAGGGWLNGARAQEECLCYRSSLSFTLKLRYYPLQDDQAIYSPTVVIIRDSLQNGHTPLDLTKPEELPIVSVISMAALCTPPVDNSGGRLKYRNSQDRELMKEKMRIILRTAAFNGHRRLSLGAFGCGAFLDPREEVADCWAEVLAEAEFRGGWWESICFAVMDDRNAGKDGDGDFGVFYRRLHGTMV